MQSGFTCTGAQKTQYVIMCPPSPSAEPKHYYGQSSLTPFLPSLEQFKWHKQNQS